MPLLQERQKSILDAVVREYVRSARPVASQDVCDRYDFAVGGATIRNEMLALDALGYLQQPHPSAGRIPTDKGYRFFVDHLSLQEALSREEEELLRDALAIRRWEDCLHACAKAVAKIAGAFAAAGRESEPTCYTSGFAAVLEEPEFADPERARGFGHLADVFDAEIRRILPRARTREQMWIGEENPWREARRFTMELVLWEHPTGFKGFVSMVAPTRTNYPKHKAITRFIMRSVQAL